MSEHQTAEDPCTRWSGAVTQDEVTVLRRDLFDQLEAPDVSILWLDVRAVTDIDRSGVALLLGAQGRATALHRQLVVLDSDGPVTETLHGLLLPGEIDLVQLPGPRAASGLEDGAGDSRRSARVVPGSWQPAGPVSEA